MMMLPRSPEVAGLKPINAERHSEVINIFVNLLNPHFLTGIPALYTATTYPSPGQWPKHLASL